MKIRFIVVLVFFFLLNNHSFAQQKYIGNERLKKNLQAIIKKYDATVGIAVINIEDGDTLTINNNHHYPMQSVYKFHLALAVLHQVDEKKFSLQQKIHVSKEDLKPRTWSPLREKFPEGNIDITIAELLNYTVSQSDNNGCDILFRLMGGTDKVDAYIHQLGIKEIAIAATEEEMAKAWDVQYTNWTQPFAMATLLEGFYHGNYLSDSSNNFLMQLMIESSNSANRIKGLLPKNIEVAHKTGTSNANEKGMAADVNDEGIITLPSGNHIALAVFVSNTTEKFETNEKLIAEISKAVFDFYVNESNLEMKIDSLLAAKTERPFNGVILISHNGKTVYSKVSGYSDLETKTLLQPNSQFVIGSISKQITAVLVLREMDKGNLKLHAPIHYYLPGLKQTWADTVTVHHMLTHMHGITALDKPLLFKPGTKFDYGLSDLGYNLLSKIVEATSGKKFAELSGELFNSCGMKNTYHPDVKEYDLLVKGYTEQANGALKFDSTSFQNSLAAGGFISTATDLVLWNESLHSGKLLKPETYKMMVTKQKKAIRNHPLWGSTDYGYGITIKNKGDILQLGQTGFAPGFASMDFYFPKTKTSVVVLENAVYNPNDLNRAFYHHIEILKILKAYIR